MLALWLVDLAWIWSWHSREKGSWVANGFGPISSLSVVGVAVALVLQAMNLKSIFQQDEYRRIRQAENFAMSFMSREMRDARDQAWKTREAFLRGSEDERRAWAESWFGQTLPEAGKKNWPVSMVIEYHVWIANFCDTLAENQQQKFRKGFIPLTHVWSEVVCGHWRGPKPSRHPRRKPSQNPSKVQPLSIREFFARFPTDDACLDHIMEVRYGMRHPCDKCLNLSTFHRLANRPAYSCAHCGHHVYPCAGTVFQDTRTPLQVWFYAIYLFVTTRNGVSAKELQRTVGVTYKTAWRMGQQIRKLIDKADGEAIFAAMSRLMRRMSAVTIPASAAEARLARQSLWA